MVGEGLKERLATGWNVLGGEERRERKRGGEEKKKKRKIASGSETGGHRAGSLTGTHPSTEGTSQRARGTPAQDQMQVP